MVSDLTPAQRAIILRAALDRRGRVLAVDHRSAAALERKGYATVTYRHTSRGYLADLTLSPRGREALAILHRAAREEIRAGHELDRAVRAVEADRDGIRGPGQPSDERPEPGSPHSNS